MNQPKRKFKRIYLINRDFQLRYTRLALLVGCGSTILTVLLILYPLFQFKIIRGIAFLPTPFLAAIVFASLLNFSLVAAMGILITHRIAGPIFSLVRHMRQLQQSRFGGEFRVRTGDDLKYLVRNYNEVVESLAAMTQSDIDRLDAVAGRLERVRGSGAVDEALALVAAMRAELQTRLTSDSTLQMPPPPSATPPSDHSRRTASA
jgi:hypothetical protein